LFPPGAGVYHFNPADVSLRLLRKGDFRGNLAQATALEPAVVGAPVTIICTGTYWRKAWKYQARTYRHFGWDNGTLLVFFSPHAKDKSAIFLLAIGKPRKRVSQ